MNLFNWGEFTLHSGSVNPFKVDCDALTDGDLDALATYAFESGLLPHRFRSVTGIPTGGLRFAHLLERYVDPSAEHELIVDNVMTTGMSMFEYMGNDSSKLGLVIFARSSVPPNIRAIWQLNDGESVSFQRSTWDLNVRLQNNPAYLRAVAEHIELEREGYPPQPMQKEGESIEDVMYRLRNPGPEEKTRRLTYLRSEVARQQDLIRQLEEDLGLSL